MNKTGSVSIIGVIPEYSKYTKNNIFSKIMMPPVGILSVLTNVIEDKRYDAYCIDENNYRGPRDFIGAPDHEFLQKKKPAKFVFLYGGMSNSIPRLYTIAQIYKRFGSIVIAGGSHVDALPKEALSKGIDIVVHGEGEGTAKEILDAILLKKPLEDVLGISFINKKRGYTFTGKREPIQNLDLLKAPDLTLVRYLKKRFSAVPISRGRGCNFNCEFCIVHDQYGKYKSRSPNRVMEDVVRYNDLGYDSFFFTDDNFAQNIEETIELCNLLKDYKNQFKKRIQLTVQVRTEIAENDKLIEAMKDAGISILCIGYESPINEELKAMKKGVTAELLEKRSRKLSKYFYLHGMFIFGYPSFKDSQFKSQLTLKEKAKRYSRFIRRARIDSFQIFKAIPIPGSVLREKLEREKRIFPLEMVDWDKYDGLWLCYNPNPEGIDPYELQTRPNLLMKKRYLGGIISSHLNYGNWINWVWNATTGFPLQFIIFYSRSFFKNVLEIKRAKSIAENSKRNIFHEPLINAWDNIKRIWRNLAVKTYGGGIVKRWYKTYNKSDYKAKWERFLKTKTKRKKDQNGDKFLIT